MNQTRRVPPASELYALWNRLEDYKIERGIAPNVSTETFLVSLIDFHRCTEPHLAKLEGEYERSISLEKLSNMTLIQIASLFAPRAS